MRRAALLVVVLALLPACQGQKNYWQNRANDVVDIVRGHVMWGKALGAQVEATRFLSLGWSSEQDAGAWGLHKRALGSWHETVTTWGLILGRHEEHKVSGIPRVSGTYGWTFGKGWPHYDSAESKAFMDWFAVRATAAVFIGLDFELRLGEVVDFVGGFFTWDPSQDDKH
ncbi:MAG TPA: hypothetical protein VK824_03105 [Planctomycetota bacterium]|nr:hypothetical protein [Planctomycetota bacterium]